MFSGCFLAVAFIRGVLLAYRGCFDSWSCTELKHSPLLGSYCCFQGIYSVKYTAIYYCNVKIFRFNTYDVVERQSYFIPHLTTIVIGFHWVCKKYRDIIYRFIIRKVTHQYKTHILARNVVLLFGGNNITTHRSKSLMKEQGRIIQYCSTRLDVLIDDLQTTITELCNEQESQYEDRFVLSLADLKQVRITHFILSLCLCTSLSLSLFWCQSKYERVYLRMQCAKMFLHFPFWTIGR